MGREGTGMNIRQNAYCRADPPFHVFLRIFYSHAKSIFFKSRSAFAPFQTAVSPPPLRGVAAAPRFGFASLFTLIESRF
jgi:hypothetical protein